MAAITAKVDAISQVGGKIHLRVGKQSLEFASRQELLAWATEPLDRILLVKILIAEWVRRNPAGNNPGQITSVQVSYELDGTNSPLKFSVV